MRVKPAFIGKYMGEMLKMMKYSFLLLEKIRTKQIYMDKDRSRYPVNCEVYFQKSLTGRTGKIKQ